MKNREILEKKFSKKEIKRRPGKEGKELFYIETSSVIKRLNEAFDGEWSFEIKEKEIDLNRGYIWVLGRLTCGNVVKEQFGFKALSPNHEKSAFDLGDDLKAAASDALKKCATLLGVGLYLYEGEEGDSLSRPASEKQKQFIRDLLKAKKKTMPEEALARLTFEEASRLIDRLKGEEGS
ncbi:MAG: Rad52/Rad22 family DNA repair protein [Candidatus Caldatribacteriaceae bacterium]